MNTTNAKSGAIVNIFGRDWVAQADPSGRENAILSWDSSESTDAEIKYRMENWEEFSQFDEKPTLKEVQEDVLSDSEYFTELWKDMVNELSEVMDSINNGVHWTANVSNFGWRGVSGDKDFSASNGTELLREILPKTDCTFFIHLYCPDGGQGSLLNKPKIGLAIQNYHHDSPVGAEWYYIFPYEQKDEDEDEYYAPDEGN